MYVCNSLYVPPRDFRLIYPPPATQVLAKKTALALKHGLHVIFCIGELLAEREGNQTEAVLERQMAAVKGTHHCNGFSLFRFLTFTCRIF
jgi:triosephosphate isomerase (TIM)